LALLHAVDCGADLKDGDEELADAAPSPSSRAGSTTSSKDRSTPTNEPTSSATAVTTATDTSVPLDVRARFGANLFLLSGIELARVIMKLEQECPQVLEHISDELVVEDSTPGSEPIVAPKLEINVDAIENPLFTELSNYVQELVGSKGFHEMEEAPPRPKKKKKT
jgi:hypothetical protein